MKITPPQAIEALGNLLFYYNSDLNYIAQFHNFKNDKISENEYLTGNSGFQEFINEYKVARNVRINKVKELMVFARGWVLSKKSLDVDSLAKDLKKNKITHDGKIMTSLASKILFLNTPQKILPIDTLNRRALDQKTNIYREFSNKVDGFKLENNNLIQKYLRTINSLLSEIEKNHTSIKIDFNVYRISRYTDKLLWVKGKNANNRITRQ